MEYQHITRQSFGGALGAELSGVDLSGDLDDEVVGEIRLALLDHLVVVFRDQELSVEQHKAFARRFGDLSVNRFIGALEGHPDVIRVVKDVDDTASFGGSNFHSDEAYFERPAMGTVLYAREVPPSGGDTMFANMYLGHETLSDGMKRMIDGLQAVNSGAHIYGVNAWMGGGQHLDDLHSRRGRRPRRRASRGPHPPRDGPQVPLHRSLLHPELRRHDAERAGP